MKFSPRDGAFVVTNANHWVQDERNKLWQLPGGGVELRETFRHCAIREFQEETGYILEESFLTLIGVFQQRIVRDDAPTGDQGTVCLFYTDKWYGEPATEPDEEICDRKNFSEEQLVEMDRSSLSLGSLRMYLHYLNWSRQPTKQVLEGRLADAVVYGSIMI